MNTMNRCADWLPRTAAAVAVGVFGVAGIIGSGGGGGGGDGGGGTPQPPALLALSSDNALDVSAVVVQAVVVGYDVIDTSGGLLEPEQAAAAMLQEPGGVPDGRLAIGTGIDIVRKLAIAVGPVTEPCDSGNGTVTISGDVDNLDTLSVGDELTLEFDQCDDNTGVILDGTLDIVVDDVQGDPFTEFFLLTLSTTFTNLSATDDAETYTVNGAATTTLDSLDFPEVSGTLSGAMLEIASGIDTFTYMNFTQTFTDNAGGVPGAIIATASGMLDSQLLGGAVNYETPVPLQASGDENPNAGEILITGADDTSVLIVIESTESVRLDIDSDGDGTVDDTQFTTWEVLAGDISSIDASNAQAVATEMFRAAFGFPGSVPGAQFTNGSPYDSLADLGVAGNFGPEIVACPTGGDASISGFVTSAGTYTAGDQLDTSFNNCGRGPVTYAGQMNVQVSDFQGTPGASFLFAGSAEFIGLTTIGNGVTSFGGIDTSYDVSVTTPATVTIDSAATSFTLIDGFVTRGLTGAQSSIRVDISTPPPPYPFTSTFSGSLQTTALDGSFDYAVGTALENVLDDDPATGPSAGDVLVTADDGSSVRIVAVDQFNARLDVDVDGDTTIDAQIDVTWADLLP